MKVSTDTLSLAALCVRPFDFPQVPVVDGISHTNDTGTPTRQAGTLRYIPSA